MNRTPIAIFAPGQGAQKPGMLLPWSQTEEAARRLAEWSEFCDIDLLRLGTVAPVEDLVDTAVVQPLVVATALLAFGAMASAGLATADTIVAGHSVGELAAAAVAEVIEPAEAVALAAARGRAMAEACGIEPTGMSAVLGGEPAEVLDRMRDLDLVPANRNGAGQIVAAGRSEALRKLAARPPDGAKVVALRVAGAFHTHFMLPAQAALADAVARIAPRDPVRPLLSNLDGEPVTSGADALAKIVGQVVSPVRWDLCVETIRGASVAAIVELPPAGTLKGLAKRALPATPGHALAKPRDITAFAETLAVRR
ncbi:ACP S-malonyltransferase [Nocardia noduli]|uniref:ACP S-malonyltransferase n=1 Tax=Nocardia noduli TaxID=2815722 RepID=UPI0027DFB31B|nr:ACP S-malonyltransferase [Nocardia noduli]